MGLFKSLFGNSGSSAQDKVQQQIAEVEAGLGRIIVDFHDRSGLPFVLIFPVMHQVAAKLFVEDFGAETAIAHYERLAKSLTAGGLIRENQFKSFGWPDPLEQQREHVKKIDTLLWSFSRDLIGHGILKEAIASSLLNVALKGAAKGIDPLIASGFFFTVLKELRAGVYSSPTVVLPEPSEGTDEGTALIFHKFRDFAYKFKELSGLEWQHLLPGMQRTCVIYVIKYRGREHTLELFGQQLAQLTPLLDECEKNPPQDIQLTPLHLQHMAKFNSSFQELADSFITLPEIHPVIIAHALSMLITTLASKHYDIVFLHALLYTSCLDIEEGTYDFVQKTH